MKNKIFIIVFVQLIVLKSFTQQVITFNMAESTKYTYSASNQSLINFDSSIEFKIFVPDVHKIKKVEFSDLNLATKISLNSTELLSISKDGIITLTIQNREIKLFADKGEVPYPFNIDVTYDNESFTSGMIGGSSIVNTTGGSPIVIPKQIVYTGIEYYNALTISDLLKERKYSYLYSYMQHYYHTTDNIKTKEQLIIASNKNEFLKEVFNNNIYIDKNYEDIANPNAGFSSLSLSSIGNLDVTNIADGFAKFLVKRTKEELNVAFFDQFNKFISSDEYKDARILFPQTYIMLQAIGDNIYNYEAYINALRESFEKDLDGLLTNLSKIIDNERYKEFFNAHPDLKAICKSSLYVGNGLMNKTHPGKIIADYDFSLFDNVHNKNIKASLQILQLFSESLRSLSNQYYWIPADSLEILIKDDVAFKIFLGLVCQKAGDIKFQDGRSFQEVLNNNVNNYKQYDTFLRNFIMQTTIVTTNIKNISGKSSDKLTFTDYYNFYNSVLDLIEKASSINNLPGISTIQISDDFFKYQYIARTGGNIALDINRKNYSSAVINAYALYNYTFGGNLNELKAIKENKTNSPTDTAYAGKLYRDKNVLNSKYKTDEFKNKMLIYASFMAAITQAQNSDDVKAAIEAVALPTGSARIKRETSFNVALNAYCGLYAGKEQIKGIDEKGLTGFPNTFGVSAPIGISISKGRSCWLPILGAFGNGHFSHSLLFSIVDIGALTAFRFTNDSTQSVPNIQLKDIISPGIFYSWGILKSPISINIGWQMGPLLREVTATQNNYSQSYSRWSISICVDLPLLNLYTKPKD